MSENGSRRRVLLKFSGEALQAADRQMIIDADFAKGLAEQIKSAVSDGVQVAIVVGGGNIFRGVIGQSLGMDRVKGDFMGMMATIINALGLESVFRSIGQPAMAQSAIAMGSIVPGYHHGTALENLSDGKVMIFAGGTGNPYFTTDTAAALRAVELGCDQLLKATKVDGVYSADPVKDPSAEKIEKLSFQEVIERNLRVMDQTAFSLCRENNMPIRIFSMADGDNLYRALIGELIGSVID